MWGEPEFMRSFFRGKMNQSRIFKKDSRLSSSLLTREECKLECTYQAGKSGMGVRFSSWGRRPPSQLRTAGKAGVFQQQGQYEREVQSVTFSIVKPEPSGGQKAALWIPRGRTWVSAIGLAAAERVSQGRRRARLHTCLLQTAKVLLSSSRRGCNGGQRLADPQNFRQVLFPLLHLKDHLAVRLKALWKPGTNCSLVLKIF